MCIFLKHKHTQTHIDVCVFYVGINKYRNAIINEVHFYLKRIQLI